MHPFYGPNSRFLSRRDSGVTGLVSMAAYLAFWAGALVLAQRELDARWPRHPRPPAASDPAVAVLRERFARGEIDEVEFLALGRALREGPGGQA